MCYNEKLFYNLYISRTGASPSDAVYCHTHDTPFFRDEILYLSRDLNQFIPADWAVVF